MEKTLQSIQERKIEKEEWEQYICEEENIEAFLDAAKDYWLDENNAIVLGAEEEEDERSHANIFWDDYAGWFCDEFLEVLMS